MTARMIFIQKIFLIVFNDYVDGRRITRTVDIAAL
jgi:hypothetical protein